MDASLVSKSLANSASESTPSSSSSHASKRSSSCLVLDEASSAAASPIVVGGELSGVPTEAAGAGAAGVGAAGAGWHRGVEPLGKRALELVHGDGAGAVRVALGEEVVDVVVVQVAVAVLVEQARRLPRLHHRLGAEEYLSGECRGAPAGLE